MGTKEVRILYMVSSLRKCGPINQLYGLIKNLDKERFKVMILTLSKEKGNSMVEAFLAIGIEVVSCESKMVLTHFSGKKLMKKLLSEFKPDIIHTSGVRSDYYAEKWQKECLHCCTIREYAYEDYPIEYGKLTGNIMAAFHLRVLSKAANPICCSHAISEKLYASHGLKTAVIQNGVDAERFRPCTSEARQELRRRLGLPVDKRIYISSGMLIERKEPAVLIKAFLEANIAQDASLVILGDGPLIKSCTALGNSSVMIKGHVDNIGDYLKAADIFVSASNSEGLPNSVLEAMSTGLPVVLSDIEPHKEILMNDRSAGSIFKTGDVSDLSANLKQSLLWDVKSIGEKALHIINNHLSAVIMSRNYQQLYLNMAGNKALRGSNSHTPEILHERIGNI